MKRHAALRLIQRFDLDIVELRHILKTAKMVKTPKKECDIGILERKLGDENIRIKFKIKNDVLWIITVEGGHKK